MRYYITTTGIVFGLLFLAHLARIWEEGVYLVSSPVFAITTVGSIGLCIWALLIHMRSSRRV